MLDLAVRGGQACLGPDCRLERADIGISQGRIVAIGATVGKARRSIDARGRIVAPGFIDIHTHSDFTIPLRPAAEAKLLQGVTTDVTGNCGFSPFPLGGGGAAGAYGSFFEPELDRRWASIGAFTDALEAAGLGINLAPLVGLGAIRMAVMGEKRGTPSGAELAAMCTRLSATLEDGAFGASSGLVYSPGSDAELTELATLAAVVARYRGVYATHVRNEAKDLAVSIDEALETAEVAGCALQISHLKVFGRENWGATGPVLEHIDAAVRCGQDVAVDVYPYTAGSTSLAVLLPPGVLEGGDGVLRATLADPHQRSELARAVAANPISALEDIVLADLPSRPDLAGRPLVAAAGAEGLDPAELVLSLVEADGRDAVMIVFGLSEDDVRSVLRHPRSIVGSDGWVMSTDAKRYTHPRSFSFTARLLAHYVRDERVLSLETAVRKMSAAPAERIGLVDRGQLAPNMAADIVVFDLDRMREVATFAEPCAHPIGFEHVVVNGEVAVDQGDLTGRRGGRVLRRPPS